MNAVLAVRGDQMEWSVEQLAALRQLGIEKASTGDLSLFLSYAQKTGLDPFSRQLYMIGRWDGRNKVTKWTIQASIDGLRIVAQRSGEYEGQTTPEWYDGQDWHDVWAEGKPPVAARVGVWRKGFREPLMATAHWDEFAASSPTWTKMPSLMLAKCAEALALRKAFPNDLSGLYTAEEMAQADHAVPRSVEPLITIEELHPSVLMAQTDDELRECWKRGHAAGLLESFGSDPQTGEQVTIADLITLCRERLSDDVFEAELVEATNE